MPATSFAHMRAFKALETNFNIDLRISDTCDAPVCKDFFVCKNVGGGAPCNYLQLNFSYVTRNLSKKISTLVISVSELLKHLCSAICSSVANGIYMLGFSCSINTVAHKLYWRDASYRRT